MANFIIPKVGRVRISKTLKPSVASYTRSVREQMKQIEKNYSAVINQLRGVTPSVLEEALRPTFDKSQEYVPVDTGDLKASGYLEVKREGKDTRAEMGYGKGGDPNYAAFVHERTDINHQSPTRAKFLQSAIEEDFGLLLDRVKAAFARRGK